MMRGGRSRIGEIRFGNGMIMLVDLLYEEDEHK